MFEMPKPIGNPKNHPYFYETPEDEFWRDVYLIAMKSGVEDPSLIADQAVASRRRRGRRNFSASSVLLKSLARGIFWLVVLITLMEIGSVASQYSGMLSEIRDANAAAKAQREP